MPLPHSVARFNRRVTNRLLGPIVMRLPGFGMLLHIGRTTQRQYRTPMKAFQENERFIFALTYGPETDWVRNVLMSGGCVLETRGRSFVLKQPRLFRDNQRRAVPWPSRLVLGILNVYDFLELTLDTGESKPVARRTRNTRSGPG